MKAKPLLIALRPRNFIRWRDLPLFGPILDQFVQWMANRGYSLGTIGKYLQGFPAVVRWLRRRRVTVLSQLTQQQLHLAHVYYCSNQQETSCVIGALESFLRESQLIPEGNSPQRSAVEAEVDRFASGNEAVDRNKVSAEDRVTLVAKGEGVISGDFGNEGTGGHSHWAYPWRTGQVQRFIVTAKPTDPTHTVYSGFYFHPEKRQWVLISSWKAPKEGGYLRGLYSFSENFGGANGHLRRKALYGNQWVRTAQGQWIELTTATFSHDPTGRADRLDRFMGLEKGQFFLSHGGFVPGYTKYGEKFDRPAMDSAPADVVLPEILAK